MNPIKNIEIKNFKSIRHIKIEDCRRVNVFVGYPNTGKSNILEALGLYSILLQPNQVFRFSELCRVKRFSELFYNKDYRNSNKIIINNKLSLEILINQSGDLELRGHDEGGQQSFFECSINSRDYLIRYGKQPAQSFVPDRVAPIRKYDFRNETLLNQKIPLSLAVPNGGNLLEVLHGNSELRKEIAALFEDYNQKLVVDDEEIIFLKYLNDDTGVSIPYHLVADTLRRLIFFKAAVLSNKESILLFEEPEAHMFPPYISKFTADITYDRRGNQFFMTTHSPNVVSDFMENLKKDDYSIYVTGYKKETGETFVRRLTDAELHEIYQLGTDLYLNLENYLFHEQQ